MPKTRTPKLTHRKDGRAVVHWKGKMYVMGKSGTLEAKTAYHRFCAELLNSPSELMPPTGEPDVTVMDLVSSYLEHVKATKSKEG